MKKGSKRCQFRRIGGRDCSREGSAGAVLYSDTRGGALLCPEHLQHATQVLIQRRMSVRDCVLWAARRA